MLDNLDLSRCPHCYVDNPNITVLWATDTHAHSGYNQRFWRIYYCKRCGGLITAASSSASGHVTEIYPSGIELDDSIPEKASAFLSQAIDTIHAPAGSVMLSASSVDAMLKSKGYLEGSLYDRINKAAEDHIITQEMARWAHEIRLDANDQRHAEIEETLPSEKEAKKCVDFAMALAQFLFVLPKRVERGLEDAEQG